MVFEVHLGGRDSGFAYGTVNRAKIEFNERFGEVMQLSDAQVMTFVIAIVVPLSLLIYSNSRISDAKETLRAETAKLAIELRSEMELLRRDLNGEMSSLRKDLNGEMSIFRKDLNGEMALLRRDMNAGFERIESAFKIHILEHHN